MEHDEEFYKHANSVNALIPALRKSIDDVKILADENHDLAQRDVNERLLRIVYHLEAMVRILERDKQDKN